MKAFAVGVCAILSLVSGRSPAPSPAALLQAVAPAPAGQNAVTRVVDLLTQLKSRIEADGRAEQEKFDKYACWCETTTSRKAASITQVRQDLQTLGSTILQLRGNIATLASEIEQLTGEIRANEEAQATATSIRQKENANYVAEKAELQQAVGALEKALQVLTAATTPSAMVQKATMDKVKAVASNIPSSSKVDPKKASALVTEIARFQTASKNGHRYTPQSATIQGILSDMYSTFASDIQSATEHESTSQRNFESFIDSKQAELKTLQDTVLSKEQAKAEDETQLADATQTYADKEAQLAADIEFFDAAKAACTTKASEWSERSQMRTMELDGISQALTILTSDEARETFGNAIQPGFAASGPAGAFLQIDNVPTKATAADKAFKTLTEHAKKAHSVRLASLAANLRMHSTDKSAAAGHFDTVIEAIDNLIAALKAEQTDDDTDVDNCKSQYHEIDLATEDLNWKIQTSQVAIEKLESLIAEKEAEKAKTIEDLQHIAGDITEMEQNRITDNQQFLQAKADDEKAIELLGQAKDALIQYYNNHGIDIGPLQLVQKKQGAGAPSPAAAGQQIDDLNAAPDATFSDKGSRKVESKGVISILTMIIEDLHNEISAGQKSEADAQLAFEDQLEAAKKVQSDLNATKANLEEMIATKETEKTNEEGTLSDNQNELGIQEQTKEGIQPHCDFITTHQEARREKRNTEMDGLKSAKEFLLGASQVGMLAKSAHVEHHPLKAVSFLQNRAK